MKAEGGQAGRGTAITAHCGLVSVYQRIHSGDICPEASLNSISLCFSSSIQLHTLSGSPRLSFPPSLHISRIPRAPTLVRVSGNGISLSRSIVCISFCPRNDGLASSELRLCAGFPFTFRQPNFQPLLLPVEPHCRRYTCQLRVNQPAALSHPILPVNF